MSNVRVRFLGAGAPFAPDGLLQSCIPWRAIRGASCSIAG